MQVRIQAAIAQRRRRVGRAETNGDEQALPSLVGNYSKGLPHDSLGEVDRSAYGALLRAVTSADFADFEAIPLGGTAKQVTPMAALAFQLEGADSHACGSARARHSVPRSRRGNSPNSTGRH